MLVNVGEGATNWPGLLLLGYLQGTLHALRGRLGETRGGDLGLAAT